MISRHDFLLNLSIKQSSCFSSWLSIKSFYQTVFMFLVMTFYQTFLPNSLHVSRHDSLSNLSIKQSSCFSSWLSIKCKKIMQKSGKNLYLALLMSQVELTRFLVESNRVKLKICSTWLESSWKCEQLDFKSSRIQNVNSKLDLTISLNFHCIVMSINEFIYSSS